MSAVYGGNTGFVPSMSAQAVSGGSPRVVADQIVCPNWSREIAAAVAGLIQRLQDGSGGNWGTYHLSGDGSASWYEFADFLFEQYGGTSRPEAVSTSQYAAAAERPAYSVLDSRKAENIFGIKLPHWKKQFCHFKSANSSKILSNTNKGTEQYGETIQRDYKVGGG